MKQKINAYDNVLDLIGNTPLLKLKKITQLGYFMHFLKQSMKQYSLVC